MASKKKDLPNKETPKKSIKNIIILVILLLICSTAGFVFFKKSPKENQEVIEVIPTRDELAFDSIPDDTISELDTLNITDSSVVEQPVETTIPVVKKSKIKITRFQLDNNPKYWKIVKGISEDTSFYYLKNNKTGTKLFNRYYTKEEAEIELKKFKNIISQ